MALFQVTEYDKHIWETELKDFLPEKILDVHTHVYREEDKDPVPTDTPKRTVSWTSTVAGGGSLAVFVGMTAKR